MYFHGNTYNRMHGLISLLKTGLVRVSRGWYLLSLHVLRRFSLSRASIRSTRTRITRLTWTSPYSIGTRSPQPHAVPAVVRSVCSWFLDVQSCSHVFCFFRVDFFCYPPRRLRFWHFHSNCCVLFFFILSFSVLTCALLLTLSNL